MINLAKTAASTYTAGLARLTPATVPRAVGAFGLGASASSTITLTIPIPKGKALANIVLGFVGYPYSGVGNGYWLVSGGTVSTNAGQTLVHGYYYTRNGTNIILYVNYTAGSSGFTVPAHTLNAIANFYDLPF
jgi:hypothetical protein